MMTSSWMSLRGSERVGVDDVEYHSLHTDKGHGRNGRMTLDAFVAAGIEG